MRKCILSTNIAETSITIPNVRYVIDSGKTKELLLPSLHDAAQQLHESFICRSSARQRAGRAGRTGPGVCFRLYSEEDFGEMQEFAVPELLRGAVDDCLLLFCLLRERGCLPASLRRFDQFPLLQQPAEDAVSAATDRLRRFRMVAGDPPRVTAFGELCAAFPLPVEQSYLLLITAFLHVGQVGVPMTAALSFQV